MPSYKNRPDFESTPTLYCVATSHLDTQWRWDIQEVISDLIPATMRDNLALFEKFPDYTFSFEGSFRYQLMEEYYPEDFARVRDAVEAGRWHVCGASVDAGDVNCVSPESLVRHILLGNQYFEQTFGRTSYDVFLPDCFGFGWALPSVMAHCGLKGFSTQKLTWGSAYGTPFSIGMWEGVDGSRVVATLDPGTYVATVDHDLADDAAWAERIQRNGEATGLFLEYMYFGVGDRGGAPTEETVGWVRKSVENSSGRQRVVNVPADLLFRELTPAQKERLPVWRNELVMTRHAIGCYTSQSLMKRWNRANERLADSAERACAAADWLGAMAYPADWLRAAWTRFLWNQMHDILPGTSIPRAYDFAWNDEFIAQNQFAQSIAAGVGALAARMDLATDHPPVLVWNPNGFEAEGVVEASACYDGDAPQSVTAYGPDGVAVPTQCEAVPGGVRVAFLAKAPSVGAAVYELRPGAAEAPMPAPAAAAGRVLESGRLRVEIDDAGDVASIFDKHLERELLQAPVRLALLADAPREWPAWEIDYWSIAHEPASFVGGPAEVRVAESGPARAAIDIVRQHEGSTYRLRVSIAAGSPRVDFDLQVDWNSRGRLLKAVVATTAHDDKAAYDLGLGMIERGCNRPELYEVPAQQWAGIADVSGAYGVAVLSDCKHGWDHPTPNTLRLSLVRTPGVHRGSADPKERHHCDSYHDQETMDLGPHRMGFAIVGHAGDWRSGVQREASLFDQPLRAFHAPRRPGPLGRSFSFARVDSPQVRIAALKKAEDGDGFIVRLQELFGAPAANVPVAFAAPIDTAVEVDGQESFLSEIAPKGGRLLLDFEPFRPRAFRVRLADAAAKPEPIAAEAIEIPFNLNTVSFNARRADGDMDGEGRSYPGEQLAGGRLEVHGVPFMLGPLHDGAANALLCAGQEIELPEGQWDGVDLLVASLGADVEAEFKLDGASRRILVPAWTGFVAGWVRRLDAYNAYAADPALWTRAPIKHAPIAHVCTHRHDGAANRDEPYEFCYLFRASLRGAGARRLVLPKDSRVRVFAATAVRNPAADASPARPLLDSWDTLGGLA